MNVSNARVESLWVIFFMDFYLLTTHNWFKQLYLRYFVISNKVVWRFNRETFVKQSMKVVSSPEKWTLRGCLYRKRNKLSHPHWSGDQNCFCLHGIFTGDVSSIWNKYDQCISLNFEISFVNFLNVLGFLLLASEKNGGYTFLICYFIRD